MLEMSIRCERQYLPQDTDFSWCN